MPSVFFSVLLVALRLSTTITGDGRRHDQVNVSPVERLECLDGMRYTDVTLSVF